MGLIDMLRKLGILRFGSGKYKFKSGRGMPAEALMDGIYDEKKDLAFDIDMNSDKEEKEETHKK